MKKIDNCTLVCIDCYNQGGAIVAIKKSLEQLSFERVLFLTHINIKVDGVETVVIDKINSKREYSEFVIKQLYKYINTDYLFIIQSDGYILDGSIWDDNFLGYDYIGAGWVYDNDRQVGNGGFSIRSLKLHKILAEDDLISVLHPEDQSICIVYKYYLEETYGITFAPVELADKFSFELKEPIQKTLGFHGNFYQPYKQPIVIKRTGALGDVIAVEPLLHYFSKKGYRVILDTLLDNYKYFNGHYYPIEFVSMVDQRILDNAITYNLDMSYESMPTKNHLQSYYEFCGIKYYILEKPKLTLPFYIDKTTILFPQDYVVLHYDKRPQPSRNIDVNFELIVSFFIKWGYNVIQVGRGEHEVYNGVIFMNTLEPDMVKYLVAGASYFIGCDSGVSHVARAFGIKSIIFSGSVDLNLVHNDLNDQFVDVLWLHNHDKKVCDKPFCWHSEISTVGVECYLDSANPPCSKFNTMEVINKINEFINEYQ
jgi:hypothetical protein